MTLLHPRCGAISKHVAYISAQQERPSSFACMCAHVVADAPHSDPSPTRSQVLSFGLLKCKI